MAAHPLLAGILGSLAPQESLAWCWISQYEVGADVLRISSLLFLEAKKLRLFCVWIGLGGTESGGCPCRCCSSSLGLQHMTWHVVAAQFVCC